MQKSIIDSFDDETILALFGAQAAEDEDPDRLRSYFVKNKTYERVKSNIPLRLIVGHKGIGKSALLKIAYLEDKEDDVLALWLQPNDIAKSWSVNGTFVERVEAIKRNLLGIIADKSLAELKIFGKSIENRPLFSSATHFISYLTSKIRNEDFGTLEANIAKRFLDKKLVRIYIDDIDRGWAATRRDIENISALINAARDLTNEDKSIHCRIGIRTDAYNLVRAHDESGDKFEPYVVTINWKNHDILVVMAKRISNYFGNEVDIDRLSKLSQKEISKHFQPIIVEKFDGAGHWANRPIHNVLLSLTRQRPRDLIKLLGGAASFADAKGHNVIYTTDLTDSFPEYSKGRVADLISEFRSELPEIERVIYSMRPTKKEFKEKSKKFLYTNEELIKKLNSISVNQNIHFKNGRKTTGQSLSEFLFKIDFVVARRDTEGGIERYYYQEHPKLQSNFVDFGFAWEVHPAYRWALDPVQIGEIFANLEI